MKFVTFRSALGSQVGVLQEGAVYPFPADTDMLSLVGQGLDEALIAGGRALGETPIPIDAVRLQAPIRPPTIRDFVTFEEHVEGVVKAVTDSAKVAAEWYEAPTFYFGNPYSIVGPEDDVPMPPGSSVLDFELEVAVVVGREVRSESPEEVRNAIFGYTILNDWSARDLQAREMKVGLGPAKGKDFAATLGPCLVTADELESYRDSDGLLGLELRVFVNGQLVGQDLLSNMSWTFEEMLSYASRGTVALPGDVLGSGTCGNGGCLAELWGNHGRQFIDPLGPGDVVEMHVEGIGAIRNQVVAGASAASIPHARKRPRLRPS